MSNQQSMIMKRKNAHYVHWVSTSLLLSFTVIHTCNYSSNTLGRARAGYLLSIHIVYRLYAPHRLDAAFKTQSKHYTVELGALRVRERKKSKTKQTIKCSPSNQQSLEPATNSVCMCVHSVSACMCVCVWMQLWLLTFDTNIGVYSHINPKKYKWKWFRSHFKFNWYLSQSTQCDPFFLPSPLASAQFTSHNLRPTIGPIRSSSVFNRVANELVGEVHQMFMTFF